MSNEELDAVIGRLHREHAETRRRFREISERLTGLGRQLQALGSAIQSSSPISQEIRDQQKANAVLLELPDDLSPSQLRALIAEYSELRGRLESQKTQLRAYGFLE